MKITCPNAQCSQSIAIERDHAGRVANCPTCGQSMQLPDLSAFPNDGPPLPMPAPTRPGAEFARKSPISAPQSTRPCAKCGAPTIKSYRYCAFRKIAEISKATPMDGINGALIECDGYVALNAFDYICESCTAKQRRGNTTWAFFSAVGAFALVVVFSLGVLAVAKSIQLDYMTSKIAFAIVWLGGLSSCGAILKNGRNDPGNVMALDANRERLSQLGYSAFFLEHLNVHSVSNLAKAPPADSASEEPTVVIIGLVVYGALGAGCIWLAYSWKPSGGWHWCLLGGAALFFLMLVVLVVGSLVNRPKE